MVWVNRPHTMNAQIAKQIAQLRDLTIAELREEYERLFGDRSRTMNRQFLFRRIAWRLQALADGDLSERAPESSPAAGNRCRPEDPAIPRLSCIHHRRIQARLAITSGRRTLKRSYGGACHNVRISADGFEYQGQKYASLSAVAFAITGTRWNGYAFFGLREEMVAEGEQELRMPPRTALRHLHAQVHRGRTGAGVQLARCATRSRRSLHRQPASTKAGRCCRAL